MKTYSLPDVHRGYEWLGHRDGYTELVALHPLFKHGDTAWNRAHNAWPIVTYLTSYAALEAVVRRYAPERLVCYGLNPRPSVLRKPDGRVRSTTDADIAISKSLVLDIDLEGTVTRDRLGALTRFVYRADEYWAGLGLQRPAPAVTGRGVHLLFAYPPILVSECPDVRERLRTYRKRFDDAFRTDLARLDARLDSTQDLRRMVRVYGTAKPDVGIVSRFYGGTRVEDPALREYLMALPAHPSTTAKEGVVPGMVLPSWFSQLLGVDGIVRNLWQGTGKQGGDQSNSGYDYTLVCHLIRQGHTSPDELGTILSLRPNGAAHKGIAYIARTVNTALARAETAR